MPKPPFCPFSKEITNASDVELWFCVHVFLSCDCKEFCFRCWCNGRGSNYCLSCQESFTKDIWSNWPGCFLTRDSFRVAKTHLNQYYYDLFLNMNECKIGCNMNVRTRSDCRPFLHLFIRKLIATGFASFCPCICFFIIHLSSLFSFFGKVMNMSSCIFFPSTCPNCTAKLCW